MILSLQSDEFMAVAASTSRSRSIKQDDAKNPLAIRCLFILTRFGLVPWESTFTGASGVFLVHDFVFCFI